MFVFDLSRNSLGKFGNKILNCFERQANPFCDIVSHVLSRSNLPKKLFFNIPLTHQSDMIEFQFKVQKSGIVLFDYEV